MTEMSVPPFSAFAGPKLLASGPLAEVAIAIKIATGAIADPIIIFDNATGKSLDIRFFLEYANKKYGNIYNFH